MCRCPVVYHAFRLRAPCAGLMVRGASYARCSRRMAHLSRRPAPMAETPRLQARKRVPDPVNQQAPRPGLQLPAKTLPSYAKSGNVAIAQSLIHRRHMSEPPRPIGVDSIVTCVPRKSTSAWCRPPSTWCDAPSSAIWRWTFCGVLAPAPLRRVHTVPAGRSRRTAIEAGRRPLPKPVARNSKAAGQCLNVDAYDARGRVPRRVNGECGTPSFPAPARTRDAVCGCARIGSGCR